MKRSFPARLRVFSIFALFTACAGGSVVAGPEPPQPSPWIVSPPCDGKIAAGDRRARQTLLKLIEEEQDDDFRKRYAIVLPEGPTGLPDDYDVLMYGEYAGIRLLRLEVKVRGGGQAAAEMVTVDGIYRGRLPVRRIDDLARQLTYAFQAEQRPKSEGKWFSLYSLCDRWRLQRIELISRDPQMPLHLRTEAWEANAEAISRSSMGVQGLAHTRFAQEVERLARKRLELLEPTEDLGREVVARLRRIPPDAKLVFRLSWPDVELEPEMASLDDSRRDDLGSIEAKLYSRLAVDWRLEGALADLERLKLRKAAARLSIAVADDPVEPLKAAMLGEDYMDFRWSLNFAFQLPSPDRIEILLEVLPRLKNAYRVKEVLHHLPYDGLIEARTAPIDKFYRETEDVDSKIVVATYLARRTQEEAYYEFLLEEALKPPEDLEKHGSVPYHRQAAMETALRWVRPEAGLSTPAPRQRQRREAVARLRTWLERIPADADPFLMEMLVSQLDLLGEPEDREVLVRYCEHGIPEVAALAIGGVAKAKPELALEKARAQIRRYVEDERRILMFSRYVQPYLGLIFWQDDKSAVELLEQALSKQPKEELDRRDGVAQARILLDYLKAEDAGKRTQHAREFAGREHVAYAWLKDVAKRLQEEGADPKQCRPLLKPRLKRSRRPVLRWEEPLFRSGEGEPW